VGKPACVHDLWASGFGLRAGGAAGESRRSGGGDGVDGARIDEESGASASGDSVSVKRKICGLGESIQARTFLGAESKWGVEWSEFDGGRSGRPAEGCARGETDELRGVLEFATKWVCGSSSGAEGADRLDAVAGEGRDRKWRAVLGFGDDPLGIAAEGEGPRREGGDGGAWVGSWESK